MAKETPASIRLRTMPCPKCRGKRVFRDVSPRYKTIALWCFECRHRWDETEPKKKT